jgi:glutamyl-tRNA synthetase
MPEAFREYLLTVLNSNFEELRIENPETPIEEFLFTAEKMSNSGALFDLNKLNDVSKDVLLKLPASRLCQFMKDWSAEFKPEILPLFEGHEEYLERILDLGRNDKKPRKDLVYGKQIFDFINYFYDEYFTIQDAYPENAAADAKIILEKYLETYDHADDQSQWFEKIRTITDELGYAVRPKDFKKNPDQYKGHVGDVSTLIRIAVMGRSQSPDVWEIQQILGEERTKARLQAAIAEC